MSNEYAEPSGVRDSPDAHRALVFATLDLAAEINTIGQVAASLIGINQTDLICLNALFRDGPTSAGRLASTIGLTSSATTTAIDRLERAGYVHRRNDPADRRRVLVVASEDGARQAFALFDGLLDALASLAAGYSESRVTLLTEMIGRFREIIAHHSEELRTRRHDTTTPHDGPPPRT